MLVGLQMTWWRIAFAFLCVNFVHVHPDFCLRFVTAVLIDPIGHSSPVNRRIKGAIGLGQLSEDAIARANVYGAVNDRGTALRMAWLAKAIGWDRDIIKNLVGWDVWCRSSEVDNPEILSNDPRGGLSEILYVDYNARLQTLRPNYSSPQSAHIRAKLQNCAFLSDPIGFPRSVQRFIGLRQSAENKQDAYKRQERAAAGNPVSPIRGIRSFFSRDSSAPLSAQIGCIVVLVSIAAAGLVVGIGRIVAHRRSGWLYLLGGSAVWFGLVWWASPS